MFNGGLLAAALRRLRRRRGAVLISLSLNLNSVHVIFIRMKLVCNLLESFVSLPILASYLYENWLVKIHLVSG